MTAITITANLTNEQALILAKEKGYCETVTNVTDATTTPITVTIEPNSESPFEFLKRVYEEMIATDAQKHYLEFYKRLDAEARRLADEKIKSDVEESISSSVE